MTLYHFTVAASDWLGSILSDGQIRTTESNLSMTTANAGPRVVWLTDSSDPAPSEGNELVAGLYPIKMTARLTVELENAQHWPEWSRAQGISEEDYETLARAGGDPSEWWVTTRPIYRSSVSDLHVFANDELGIESDLRFEGKELRRLFQSAGARRALGLPTVRKGNAV